MAQHSETGNVVAEGSDANLDLNDLNRESARSSKCERIAELRLNKVRNLRLRVIKQKTEENMWVLDVATEKLVRSVKRWEYAERLNKREIQNISPSANDEYSPAKRGLTRQLAMLLLDELFPNLKDASNKAKGEFLQLLTGFDAEALRQKWTDYQRGNSTTLGADKEKVAAWKKKLKISDQQK